MQVGMFMQPVHDPRRDLSEVLRQDRETIILADRLGFAEAWIGEHVSATVEPITAPLTFMGTLLPVTHNIRLGTGVFCMPQQHPAVIAAHAAMFDHLAGGRFMMGIGPGGLSSDIEIFDVGDPARRGRMTREAIDIVLKIGEGEPPYDIRGEFWQVRVQDMSRDAFGVGHFIKPLQRPHPPIAVSLMSPDSANARLAGERGWIPITGSCLVQPRLTRSHWAQYVAGCEAAGRRPDPSVWRVTRSVWVAPSDGEAADYLASPGGPFEFYFRYVMSAFGMRNTLHFVRPDGREQDESVEWLDIARSQVEYGSPKTVLDRLVAFAERMGPFGTLLLAAHEWDDEAACRRSMQLFAEEVQPRLAQHLGTLRAAE